MLGLSIVAAACAEASGSLPVPPSSQPAPAVTAPANGIHKIRHVIVIVQENRSFDSYFGTYPGADGLPRAHGRFTTCLTDPATGRCIYPFHDRLDENDGGPHGLDASFTDIDHGRMDGFMRAARVRLTVECRLARTRLFRYLNADCAEGNATEVMGYHNGHDLPNYWVYARHFVLQDHMFEDNFGWSLPAHLFLVSAWSATCSNPAVASTCVNDLRDPGNLPPPDRTISHAGVDSSKALYAWTDLTYLLNKDNVSWRYYLTPGSPPDPGTPEIWDPLPHFTTVHDDKQLGNVVPSTQFFTAARSGTLPAVSWVIPDATDSEHPPAPISKGQTWVTRVVNAVMRSPDWDSSAIFIKWDDWGGFYDHVRPPKVDENGYGIRIPALMISPYAKRGYIDHQVLAPDAYLKFIEDDFLGGARLDPKTDGRPDPRPDVRENVPILGDLRREFDFNQRPRRPFILPLHPKTDLIEVHDRAAAEESARHGAVSARR